MVRRKKENTKIGQNDKKGPFSRHDELKSNRQLSKTDNEAIEWLNVILGGFFLSLQ